MSIYFDSNHIIFGSYNLTTELVLSRLKVVLHITEQKQQVST